MLTHANWSSNIDARPQALDISHEDVALSFLPLSHAFERMVSYMYLLHRRHHRLCRIDGHDRARHRDGASDGADRRAAGLREAARARSLEGAQAAAGAEGGRCSVGRSPPAWPRAKAVLRETPGDPRRRLRGGARRSARVLDHSQKLGGRLRFLVSGSAPLGADVLEFFYAIGLPIVEGYGLTETAPILTVNPPDAPRVRHRRAADPGRRAADCRRRRDPGARAEHHGRATTTSPRRPRTCSRDGWFTPATSARSTPAGYLRSPTARRICWSRPAARRSRRSRSRASLKRSPLVAEAVVLGDRRRYRRRADRAGLRRARTPAAGARPSAGDARGAGRARADVIALYQEIVDALNRELSQFERIKRIALLPREFTIESGELTPTLKVKRKVVEERWRSEIGALYNE